jgi:hypothetical protein
MSMGVYIKGMETPKSCYFCPCNKDDGFGFFTCGVTKSECDFLNLPSDCPLFPVPPHGRLIDADALKASIAFAEKTADWAVPALRAVLMVIDEMPTIIEAEEE